MGRSATPPLYAMGEYLTYRLHSAIHRTFERLYSVMSPRPSCIRLAKASSAAVIRELLHAEGLSGRPPCTPVDGVDVPPLSTFRTFAVSTFRTLTLNRVESWPRGGDQLTVYRRARPRARKTSSRPACCRSLKGSGSTRLPCAVPGRGHWGPARPEISPRFLQLQPAGAILTPVAGG